MTERDMRKMDWEWHVDLCGAKCLENNAAGLKGALRGAADNMMHRYAGQSAKKLEGLRFILVAIRDPEA